MKVMWSIGKVGLGAAQVAFGFKKAIIVGIAGHSVSHPNAHVFAMLAGKRQVEAGMKRCKEGLAELGVVL